MINPLDSSCSPLEKLAEQARLRLLQLNLYNSSNNVYTKDHPNATITRGGSDDPFNAKGKGTGIYLDTSNGGSAIDANGSPSVPESGRKLVFMLNKWNVNNQYNCRING